MVNQTVIFSNPKQQNSTDKIGSLKPRCLAWISFFPFVTRRLSINSHHPIKNRRLAGMAGRLAFPLLLFLLNAPRLQAACAPLPDGLVSWWRSESNAMDHVGTNHGAIVGTGAAFTNGVVGTGFRTAQFSRHVQVPHSSSLAVTGAFTIEGWIRHEGRFGGYVFSKYSTVSGRAGWTLEHGGDQGYLAFHVDGDGVPFNGSEREVRTATNVVPKGVFKHVAISFQAAPLALKIYVDGVEMPTTLVRGANISQVAPTVEPLRFGGTGSLQGPNVTVNRFEGTVDEVGFYNRALGSNEIAAIATAGIEGKCLPGCEAFTYLAAVSSGRPVRVLTVDTNKAGLCNGQPMDFASPLYQSIRNDLLTPAKFGTSGTVNRAVELLPPVPAISLNILSNADVLVLSAGGYTDSERDLLRAFVRCGGGILAYGNSAAVAMADIVGAQAGGFTGSAQAVITTGDSPVMSGPFGQVAVNTIVPTGFAGSFASGGLGSNGIPIMGNDAGVFAATFSVGNGRVVVFCDEELFIDPPSVFGCYAAHLGTPSRTLFLNGFAHVLPQPPASIPLTLVPTATNAVVSHAITFTATGGLLPHTFSLATNASGGSINAFSGVYVAGPLANVTDTVRVRDAFGSNALATVSVLPDLTPRADLAVFLIAAPATATSSAPVELIWVITNRGNATASAPWTERLFSSADTDVGNDTFLAGFLNSTALPVGGSLTRTQTVVLPPDSPAGATRFVVQVDADGQVNESSEGNNITVAAVATAIAPQLFLTPASGSVAEGGAFSFTVTRNGSRAAALTVALNSTDTGELAVPTSLVIPVGASSVNFNASAVADGAFDGTQPATVSAAAAGFTGASATLLVLDADVPHLTLTLATNRITEGDSVLATVTREIVTAAPVIVEVSNIGGQIAFPTFVTIPAGTNSATFVAVAVGDTAVERPAAVTLRVAASELLPATANLTVEDDDLPVVVITLANATVGEGAGANATQGTVTRDRNSPRALVVALASGNTAAARVPVSVTIPAGQTQASFPIAAVDDGDVDGTQSALISGIILETSSSFPVGMAVPATLSVTDDDGPALRLTLARELVGEGLIPATTGTVSRNNGTSGSLTIALASSDTTEATVPASVVIPEGANAISFPITSLGDGTNDGNQSVSFNVSAAGFAPASATLVVSDTDLPDLVFTRLDAPTNAVTGALVDITFRLENLGLAAAGTNFTQRVLLSTDGQAGDDTLLSQATFNGTIPVGLFFEQTARVRMPPTPGSYWIVVAADVNSQIAEGLENNNARVTTVPIVVEKAYTATVIVDVEVAPTGTPVLLHGHASRTGSGAAAAFEPVKVHLSVRGTKRVIAALTDAAGNYAVPFQPLPGEAGVYSVGADHPGVANPPPQDSFTLLGLRVEPPATLRVIAGASATNTLVVQNLGNVPLSGLTATAISGPTNLALALTFANPALAADGTTELQAIVTSPPGLAGSATFRVRVTSAEGAIGEFDLPVNVETLLPRLVATPGAFSGGMQRGGVTAVQFAVTNAGGASSGPVSVLLPPLPWLAVSAGAGCPPLAPGEGMLVTLSLTPPSDLPLGDHSGSVVVDGGISSVTVPFTFRALSDNTGTLRLSAVDELTFYAEGSPKLTNASIRLSDPASGATVLTTNLNGHEELLLPNLAEAFYTLRLEAPGHAPYQETFLLLPARTNDVVAFLSRQTVRYTWTVEPVVIEDRYEVTVETVFETSVPLPVITVEPQVIDLSKFPGTTKQVDVSIRNRGLLAAQNMRLSFGSHPSVLATPLIEVIGELPAQGALTIPVTFSRRNTGGFQPASDGDGDCQLGGKIEWTIDCAGQQITHVVPLAAINLADFGVECGTSAQFFAVVGGGPPGGVNFAAVGGGLNNPGYTAPIAFAEKSVCDPCFQQVGGGLLQNCLPLLPLPIFDDEVGPQQDCESGAGTAQQFIACMQDALDDVNEVVEEPLEDLGELAEDLGDDGEGLSDAVDGASSGLDTVGDILGKLQCLAPLLDPCITGVGGNGAGFAPASSSASPPITAPLTNRIWQALAYVGRHTNLFGSDLWFRGTNLNTLTNWLSSFRQRVADGSENGSRVAPAERAFLLALPAPTPVTTNEAARFIDRWNRTVDYNEAGHFNLTNVPPGQSLDFIARNERLQILAASRAAHSNAVAEGFRDVAHAFNFTRQQMLNQLFANTGGTCAKVRLRLEQEAVISRDAFQARLEIENSTTSPLDEIGVTLLVTDESGANRTELFQLRAPTLDGLSGVDGTGLLPAQSTGSSAWFLVPAASAAPTNRTRYFVSGALTYRQDGTRLTVPLAPAVIDVLPTPKLVVDYFHERDVFSDDPFTPEVEPAIPYSLAVRVGNEGQGAAKNFRITSAQPEIVDNDKGLFIHFEIIATEVGGVGLSPALTADFGNIAPGAHAVGRWLFRSSLQGLFTSYDARFEHVSGLGDQRFSLIDRVDIHEMIHLVQADRAFEDGLPDFLVNDVPDVLDRPDTLHFSQGGSAPVIVLTNAVADAPATTEDLTVQLTTTLAAGWNYLRAADPANGQFRLREVRRADNTRVAVETNAWRTDRTFIGFGQRPVRENLLHLLDFNAAAGTQTYTLLYEPTALARDTNAPVSAVAGLSTESAPSFSVAWSGDDGTNGSGVAFFDIFVADNGGPFTNWLARTTVNGAIFDGAPGRTYAFFSRATDAEGNTENAPPTADTQTSTSVSNRPPTLAFPATVAFDEGTDIAFNLLASDPDAGQGLTFELVPPAPAGLVLNPATGRLTFPTSEGTGPASFPLTVRVRDNGVPLAIATASATLVVREVNQSPVLAPIADHVGLQGIWLRVTNSATDSDLPANTLTFSLAPGAPTNALIDTVTGLLRWNPTPEQSPSTNRFTVVVTDDGTPTLSATRSFTVIVRGQSSYFTLGLGTTNVFGGESNAVPVNFITGFDLSEASVQLDVRGGALANLHLSALAPEVGLASLEPIGLAASRLRFVFNNLPSDTGRTLAQLGFGTVSNGPSSACVLALSEPAATTVEGAVFTRAALSPGLVVVVNDEPVLLAHRLGSPAPMLTLFGRPGRSYGFETTTSLTPPQVWQAGPEILLEGLSYTLPLPANGEKGFFRAFEFPPAP